MYNHVHATSIACSTGTSTLSYDRPAQCYCQLLLTDSSRELRAIANDRTFTRVVGCKLKDCGPAPVLLSTLLSLQCFSNPRFPVSFPLNNVSSNGADNGHGESVAAARSRTG